MVSTSSIPLDRKVNASINTIITPSHWTTTVCTARKDIPEVEILVPLQHPYILAPEQVTPCDLWDNYQNK